jgi:nucleoside-diphosphate-sugar epimerase
MIKLIGKRYLVTGGAGFIGSHLCEEIVKQGKKVICLDNVFRKQNLDSWWDPSLCTFAGVDITDYEAIRPYFDGVDFVFNEACSKCTVCKKDPARDLNVNALGALNVFRASIDAGVEKVVHASTGSINNFEPKSFYGVSKMAGEGYLKAVKEYHPEFRFTSIRYYHVYGPRQDSRDFVGGVVPIFIRRALSGLPLLVTGNGQQKRHFTYVKDVVNFNFKCETAYDGECVSYAEKTSVTVEELALEIKRRLEGSPSKIEYVPIKKGEIFEFKITENKIDEKPHYWDRFSKNLEETITHYGAQQER